jgi:hypothetical protein
MKKTYSNPQIEVITMATRQMLANSLASSFEVEVEEGEFTGNFNSRKNDFLWDEDGNEE